MSYQRFFGEVDGEPFLVLAADGREAGMAVVAKLGLDVLNGSKEEEHTIRVLPLWYAYNSGLVENAEVSTFPILIAREVIAEFETARLARLQKEAKA